MSDEEAGQAALIWAVGLGMADQVMKETKRRVRRRRLQVSGGIVALLAIGIAWQVAIRRPDGIAPQEPPKLQSFAKISLPVRQVLADGSIVELKNDAEISVDFSGPFRRVRLRRGEAHFQVAKNAERPFVVTAGGVEARAVGTAFSVQLDRGAVEVLVTEGQVDVKKATTTLAQVPSAGALVTAGNRAVVDLKPGMSGLPKVEAVSALELEERLSWRVPRLEFSATPLVEVMPFFNRYSHDKIVLGDPALGTLQLSGVLRADNTHALLRILELGLGIKAERHGEIIVLRKL